MAARSIFKLFNKTCSCTLTSTCPLSSLPAETKYRKPQRSISHSPERQYRTGQETFFQIRAVSKSLENLRESRYKEEEEEDYEQYENESPRDYNKFPVNTDVNMRETAKEFKEREPPEEKNEEGSPIYELTEGSRSEQNYFDVINFMRKQELAKLKRLFVHLQPNNLKPYGSKASFNYPEPPAKRIQIVYPVTHSTSQTDRNKPKTYGNVQQKEFSSYRLSKENLYEQTNKSVAGEMKQSDLMKKSYSTSSLRKLNKIKQPTLKINKSYLRRSSSLLNLGTKEKKKQINEEVLHQTKKIDYNIKKLSSIPNITRSKQKLIRTTSSKQLLFERARNRVQQVSRKYNTESKTDKINCDDYVTVKLSDLKEECRKMKKCKPKKISFGRLPKLPPSDCPCIDDVPLKEGKPLIRLKKRFEIKDRDNTCVDITECTTPRADDNYVIKPKSLPTIKVQDCPCEERVMTDLIIRRLPKKKIAEPKREICEEKECTVPRADGTIVVEKKVLPKIKLQPCPCIEEAPPESPVLKRLIPKEVKEPEKICIEEKKCVTERADKNLVVTKKTLRPFKSDCVCVEPPPMEDVKPLRRLKKVKIAERPRKSCEIEICSDAVRADSHLKVEKKTLPLFVPQDCPPIKQEIPSGDVKLKRLPKVVIEQPRVCKEEEVCGPRADDGLVVKPKQLPQIELKPCPCVEIEMVDAPPLRKLIPRPVEEPPKTCEIITECITPRCDDYLEPKQKKLPPLPPGNCPCIEPPPPVDVKPLKKLKKKPVSHKRICPKKEEECVERADEHLKVKVKKLPVLEVPNCPCIEQPPPEDVKPLRRLRKVHIPEPPKVCIKKDDCEDIPRADEDDWLYWKRVEVKPPECDDIINKKNKRSFCTLAKRHYSTRTRTSIERDIFNLKYDFPPLPSKTLKEKAYNIIIDIKPSAPLILTQKPLESNKKDNLEGFTCKELKRSKSEPVTFVIYKNNCLGNSKALKESSSDSLLAFNTTNRFISTCSTLCETSERSKDKLKDHVTPSCECPKDDAYLQPKNPILPKREHFITPYPDDKEIDASAKKSRLYYRTRKDESEGQDIHVSKTTETKEMVNEPVIEEKMIEKEERKMSLWERIINYFKAKPCPSPEELKKMRLKEDAEKAAAKAGLCLYDPKELLRKNEKELPKVITADSVKEDCNK